MDDTPINIAVVVKTPGRDYTRMLPAAERPPRTASIVRTLGGYVHIGNIPSGVKADLVLCTA